MQPLDAGIIASLKKRQKKSKVGRAVDLIGRGITQNYYDCDVRMSTLNIYKIRHGLDYSIIQNCWRKTEINDFDACKCMCFEAIVVIFEERIPQGRKIPTQTLRSVSVLHLHDFKISHTAQINPSTLRDA